MSASASASQQETTNVQQTAQGGGAGSTTIVGGGTSSTFSGGSQNIQSGGGKLSIDYNDPAAALAAINSASQTIQEALQNSNSLEGQVAQIGAAQDNSNANLIQQVLSQEQALASYQGTNGGLGAQQAQTSTTKYIIWGGIGIAALAILGFLFRK